MKNKTRKDGYLQVTLSKNSKQVSKYVHRLVCESFIDNECNLKEVNHINEVKQDNRLYNLEWCPKEYNLKYDRRSERIQMKIVCIDTGQTFNSIKEAGEKLLLYPQNICRVCKGKRNMVNGLKFMYI